MKCSEPTVLASIPAKKKNIIQITMGLLGFETIKNYALLSNAKESPFLWLEAQDNPAVTFLIMPPSVLYPTYQPEISQEDVRQLALERAGDAMVLGIVLLLPDGKATVNLRGPIIVNSNTMVAEQATELLPAWLPLTNAPTLTATNTWAITLPLESGTRYFRLRVR